MVAHPYGRIKRRIHSPVFARTGWLYGMRRYSPHGPHISLYTVWANKTAHSCAGIRPHGVVVWYSPVFAPRVCICGIKRTTIVTTINAN
jgi:hypothetical protein